MKPEPIDHDFIELVNRHQNIIHKICHLYAALAEDKRDLFQEILFQLWKSYASFKQEAKFSTWMYRIALNTAVTSFRKIQRQPIHVEIDETLANELKTSDDSDRDERIEMLYAAIDKLNQIDKAVVLLYLDDLSYKEMAEVLGLSEGNIRVKINRIKSKLQELMPQ